jgi:hypothetical protein
MTEDHDWFEESLQEDLRRMADEAPAAPGISQVKLRLRRRRIRRFAWASMVGMGVGALVIIGTLAYLYLETLEDLVDPQPEVVTKPEALDPEKIEDAQVTPDVEIVRVRPVPIPRDASDETIRARFKTYMRSIGAESGTIEKRIVEGPSFSLVGDILLENEDLLEEIDILLENFDEASLVLVGGEVRGYSVSRMKGI